MEIVEKEEKQALAMDPFKEDQWHLDNFGKEIAIGSISDPVTENSDIDYTESLEYRDENSKTVVVAITDDGVDITHPDLANQILRDETGKVVGFDFVTGKEYTNPEPASRSWGHGTHVAGIIAAEQNGIGGQGVCGNCKIMPVRFLGEYGGTLIDGLKTVYYSVDNGADVINASWGSSMNMPSMQTAIDYAYSKDVLFVASAGNTGYNEDIYPSSHENVISVAASDANGKKAYFSTFNKSVDIIAPGQTILSTLPLGSDLYNDGQETGQPNPCEDRNHGESNDGYGYCSGTSMSAPVVSGMVAQLKSNFPGEKAAQTKSRLLAGTKPFTELDSNLQGNLGSGDANLANSLSLQEKVVLGSPKIVIDDKLGNNDAVANVGEEFVLQVKIENTWKPVEKVTAKLKAQNQNLIVFNDQAESEGAGMGEYLQFDFEMASSTDLANGIAVPIEVELSYDGITETKSFDLDILKDYTNSAVWNFENDKLDWKSEGDFTYYPGCDGVSETGVWHTSSSDCQQYYNFSSGTLTSPKMINNDEGDTHSYVDITYKLNMEELGVDLETLVYPDIFDAYTTIYNYNDDGSLGYKYNDPLEPVDTICGQTLCPTDGFETKRFYVNKYAKGRDFSVNFEYYADSTNTAKGLYIRSVEFATLENKAPVATVKKEVIVNEINKDYNINIYDYVDITDDTSTKFYTYTNSRGDVQIINSSSTTGDVTLRLSRIPTTAQSFGLNIYDDGYLTTYLEIPVKYEALPTNTAPVIKNKGVSVDIKDYESGNITQDIVALAGISDPENDQLKYQVIKVEGTGTNYLRSDGSFIFQPLDGIKTVTLNYTVSDKRGLSATGKVSFTINWKVIEGSKETYSIPEEETTPIINPIQGEEPVATEPKEGRTQEESEQL